MSYILLMTIAGSILFLGYLLWERLMGRHVSQEGKYKALSFVLLAYLVPWVWLKSLYSGMANLFQRYGAVPAGGHLVLNDAAIYSVDEVALTPDYSKTLLTVGIWVTGAVAVLLIRCGFYFYNRRKLLKHSVSCKEEMPRMLVEGLERELNLRRRPQIVRIPGGNFSFTIGSLKSVIFLQEDCRDGELEWILRHELIHIAKGDLLVKLMADLVCCVHWFNPLVYFLVRKLERACEKSCDERVVLNKSDDEREIYARLIVRSMRTRKKRVLFGSYLASGEKYAEERVRVIMNKRKIRRWEKIVVAGVFAAMVFADSLTAMAYPEVYHVETMADRLAEDSVQGSGALHYSRVNSTLSDTSSDNFYPVVYDEEIITAEGEIIEPQPQTRWFCFFHDWKEGSYQTHVRDDNGGCTIKIYDCTYCLNCNTIKVGDLQYTIISATCTHDDL